ncbi:SpaA isopeptide-forming pilin-related protein [Carnobacterium maltaromaticum]|uniref:MSCRAMM family protein n=1 Tax=Carnobacterium maltaromaticum TaxID=2751 RepID=UPI00298B06D2|nr:SpaA isopeptide-forming pilin-related protein [Carnobacterium maltaromaticum]MDW5524576.1 SpaA isopeptide-forming pilin-related protein [Carnobacterium maltaromaticum]
MRKKISILLIIVCVLPLINLKLVIAETTSKLVGIELKYPENQDFIVATADTVDVVMNLELKGMKKGETTLIEFSNKAFNYSLESFEISGNYKVVPNELGIEIIALKDVPANTSKITIPMRYSTNVEYDQNQKIDFSIDGSSISVDIMVNKYKSFVDESELIKKVAYGINANGNAVWGVFLNYNEKPLTGTKDIPFVLGDIVGEGHELIANTIAVYNVNKPINEDGSRNLNNDGYNYDISALLQQKSTITANGFTYTDDDFNGFPKLDGLKEKNTKAYYIIYETKVVDSDQEWLKNDVYLEGIIAEPGNGGDPLPFTENSSVSISTISSGGGGTEVGSIEFIKVDSETKAPLANAEFVIKDGEGNIVQTILTNEDGKGTALDLLYGSYTLEETKAPIGYTLDETPYPFEINDSEKVINLGEVTNQKILLPAPTGSIEFIKVDSETKAPLANAEFVIKDGEGNVVQTILTDEDGKGIALDLLYGSYTLEETKAPIGYTLDETPYPFEINDSEKSINLGEVTNQKILLPASTGSIEFIKVDSETKAPLANAEFVIKDGEGNVVQTILTNEDGKGTALDLLYGSYTLEETKAPIGYTLDETPYPFEINDSEKAINLGEVTNQKIMLPAPTCSIEFIKVDSETKSLDGLTIKNTKTTNLQMNLPQSGENNKVGQRIKIVGLLLVFISIYLYVSRLKKRVNLKY